MSTDKKQDNNKFHLGLFNGTDKLKSVETTKESLSKKLAKALWKFNKGSDSGYEVDMCRPTDIAKRIYRNHGGVNGILDGIDNLGRINKSVRKNKYFQIFQKTVSYVTLVNRALTIFADQGVKIVSSRSPWEDFVYEHLNKGLACDWDDLRNKSQGFNDKEVNKTLFSSGDNDVFTVIGKWYEDPEDGMYKKMTASTTTATYYMVVEFKETNSRYILIVKDRLIGPEMERLYFNSDEPDFWDNIKTNYAKLTHMYLSSYNTEENAVYLGDSLETVPRTIEPVESHFGVDAAHIAEEINTVLTAKERRGYMFVGNPGTGKTTQVHNIANSLPQYPLIYASPENFGQENYIERLEGIIERFQPCIVCIEDIDSLNLKEKNGKTGALLTLIDNSKNNASVVFLATVNNTRQVNYTLTRPGRFDTVIDICEPKTVKDVIRVIDDGINYIDKIDKIDHYKQVGILNLWKLRGFTQAEIGELFRFLVLSDKEISPKNVAESIKHINESKKNLKKYSLEEE